MKELKILFRIQTWKDGENGKVPDSVELGAAYTWDILQLEQAQFPKDVFIEQWNDLGVKIYEKLVETQTAFQKIKEYKKREKQ